MNVLIVEDEPLSSERLTNLIKKCEPQAEVIDCLDTVEETVDFFKGEREVDLLFLDIHLSDGNSFEIFKHITLDIPIIFTTAYDQYTLQAFKLNSIDYLLKPIATDELNLAIEKYHKWSATNGGKQLKAPIDYELLSKMLHAQPEYKKRFMVKFGDRIQFKNIDEVSYIFADGKIVYIVCKHNSRKFIIDHTLEELESKLLDPTSYFRINRKFIVNVDAISDVRNYANSRLKIALQNPSEMDMIVSRDRVHDFKNWLNH